MLNLTYLEQMGTPTYYRLEELYERRSTAWFVENYLDLLQLWQDQPNRNNGTTSPRCSKQFTSILNCLKGWHSVYLSKFKVFPTHSRGFCLDVIQLRISQVEVSYFKQVWLVCVGCWLLGINLIACNLRVGCRGVRYIRISEDRCISRLLNLRLWEEMRNLFKTLR